MMFLLTFVIQSAVSSLFLPLPSLALFTAVHLAVWPVTFMTGIFHRTASSRLTTNRFVTDMLNRTASSPLNNNRFVTGMFHGTTSSRLANDIRDWHLSRDWLVV